MIRRAIAPNLMLAKVTCYNIMVMYMKGSMNRGGSRISIRGVLLVQMRANFLDHAHFSCIFASQTELQQLQVSEVQILAKVNESTTLLASI